MNRSPLSQFCRLTAALCLLALLCIAAPAFAADAPVPVPQPADSGIRSSLMALYPVGGEHMSIDTDFRWTDIGADLYNLKFKNLRTGKTLTRAVDSGACSSGECAIGEYQTGLHLITHDGDAFTWTVEANIAFSFYFSPKARAVINEVDKAALVNPQTKAMPHSFANFQWTDSSIASTFILKVKDAATGKIAYKQIGFRNLLCLPSICAIGVNTDLDFTTMVVGHRYTWTVTAVSISGEKSVSKKASFNFVPFQP